MVGSVPVGGDAPISVQTMTNTLTTDEKSTIEQIQECAAAGADLIRVSCPDIESTDSLRSIVKASPIPIIADIHFHYKRGIEAAEAGAACLRINPGNIGSEERVKEVIRAAKDNNCSMRIGVNAGSLEKDLLEKYGEPCPEAMVESGLDHIKILEDNDIAEIVYTDVDKDGMLNGMNFDELNKLLKITNIPIIASGGVTSIEDIKNLSEICKHGISGVIIGKALYENRINLSEVFNVIGN